MIRLTDEATGARYDTPGKEDNVIDVPYESLWHVSYVVPVSWGKHVGEVSETLGRGTVVCGEVDEGLSVVWTGTKEEPAEPRVLAFTPRSHVQDSLDWQTKSGGLGHWLPGSSPEDLVENTLPQIEKET